MKTGNDEDFDFCLQSTVDRINEVGARVEKAFVSEFERLKAEGSAQGFDIRFGFANGLGKLDTDRTAIKFVLRSNHFVTQKVRYLPYFKDVTSAFDIGVGPGHLFVLLQDVMGISVRGVDVANGPGEFLYRTLWQELGIADRVSIFAVRAGVDVPIPENTQAVLAFGPVFEKSWGEKEHSWFVEMCRSHGAQRLYWHFNKRDNFEEIVGYYRKWGAEFPREHLRDPGFCILRL